MTRRPDPNFGVSNDTGDAAGPHTGLTAAVQAVLASLAGTTTMQLGTLRGRTVRILSFASFAGAHGMRHLDQVTPEVAKGFIESRRASGAPASPSERLSRLSSLRLLYRVARELHLATSDPTLDIKHTPEGRVSTRPLTDAEVERARSHAVRPGETRRAVCWALAEAGARTPEISHLRLSDLDLEAGTVSIHGGTVSEPRTVRLTPWGVVQLRRRVRSVTEAEGPDPILMGEGRWDAPESGRTTASMVIGSTLREAGLFGPDVSPLSIPAWAGAKAMADGATIDAVARMLGVRSLDQAAAIIGFQWREDAT
ncbi:MAG: site-specific integrase [Actinomycetota bacterium]|nr:site-specific integrase [Actinomycetota bacterium]